MVEQRANEPAGAPIPIARPSFDAEEERRVALALRSGWVTQGPLVAEFERAVAAEVGAREAVAVANCTAGLFLGLHALGIGPGDEVVAPALTFIASVNAIRHAGATPVLVDVDPRTYCIDPAAVEAALTPRTRAILPVDQLGIPCDMPAIAALASARGIAVVEDAACAIGSRLGGRPVGLLARLACWSFHPRKVVVTGEGGMITTDDAELAARLRLLRHQGMSVSDLERHNARRAVVEEYPVVGYNFRLSDVQAALGVAQMEKLPRFLAERRRIARDYDAELSEVEELELPRIPPGAQPNGQSYILRLRRGGAAERNALIDELAARGVASRRGLMAVHREACYAGVRSAGSLRHSEEAADRSFLLPIWPGLTDADRRRVVAALREALPRASKVGGAR